MGCSPRSLTAQAVETRRAQLRGTREWKGPRVSSRAGKVGLGPSAGVLTGSHVWRLGHRPGLRVSCCGAEPISRPAAWRAPASWEAGGSPARPWGGPGALSESAVSESDKERTFSHWERESCQDPGKDQVVGDENRLLAGCGVQEGRAPILLPPGPPAVPSAPLPGSLSLRGGTIGF